ncbi:MAG: ABC transporter permease [Anaerolineaceae bacterium]|jgi:ABC-2 type transport system permease protein
MFQRIFAIIQKEFSQVLRDRTTLIIMLSMPLLQLILFGYAINTNVRHIPTVVADQSMDHASQAYIDDMVNSGYFDIVQSAPDQAGAIQAIDAGTARVGIVIPPNFAEDVQRSDAQVLVLVDGSDLFTSQSANAFATIIGQEHAINIVTDEVARAGASATQASLPALEALLRVLYNPDMKDLWFIIPGMVAMLLQTQSLVLTTAAVVREREMGTIEQILVTPIRPIELMIGKIVPYVVIAMLNMLTVVGIGVFWFGVPFQGSIWLYIGLSFLYVFSGLGLGLLISSVSQNQRQAQQLMMLFMMVSLLLGGFIFPRYTMPPVIQAIGDLFPLTYFVPISRGIFTKGVGFSVVAGQVLAMVAYILVVIPLAALTFRKRLD